MMTRRFLSLPVLAITLVIAGLAGTGLFAGHSWQVSRTARVFLAHAQLQEEKSNWQKSAEYLDRYLRLQPNDHAARNRLAETYARGAVTLPQKRTAVGLCYRALSTGSTDRSDELRQLLMGLLVETGRFLEAEQEARRFLNTDGVNPKANRALAMALWGQLADGSLANLKPKEVGLVQSVDKACQLCPQDVELAVIKAAVYREQASLVRVEFPKLTEHERHQRADQSLDDLVRAEPKNPTAYLARHLYRVRYGIPGANSDLNQALSLAPDDLVVLRTAGFAALREGASQQKISAGGAPAKESFSRAAAHFSRLIEKHPLDCGPDAYLSHGDAYLELGNDEQAKTVWRRGLRKFEKPWDQVAFHSRIADYSIARENWKEAGETIALIDQNLDRLGAGVARDERLSLTISQDLRRATWQLKNGQASEAVSLLRGVIAAHSKSKMHLNVSVRAWLLLGQAYAAVGEYLESAIATDRAASLQPGTPSIQLAAARAWLLAERPDLASERAEQAIGKLPTFSAWFLLALAQLQQQTSLPVADRSWSRLEQAISTLESSSENPQLPEHWRLVFLKADYLILKAKTAEDPSQGIRSAEDLLRSAEKRFPGVEGFWAQLAVSYEHLGKPAEADRVIGILQGSAGQPLDLAIATARVATLRKNYQAATTGLEDACKSLPPVHLPKLRDELISVAMAKQDFDLLKTYLQAEHQRNPHNLAVIQRLAEIDLGRRDFAALGKWDQALRAMGSIAEPLRIYIHSQHQLSAAVPGEDAPLRDLRSQQTRLSALRPSWAEAATLRGMIEARLGNHEQAIASFEQALQLGERRISVFEQLIALLDRSNRLTDCDRYLSRLESQTPHSQRLTELASTQRIRFDQPQQALEIARQGVAKRPQDPLARIWLGRLLLIAQQPAEAEREFAQACELAPEDVRTWNGLFSFYLRTGAAEKARQTLQQLVGKVKLSAAERNFVLAQGSELLGEWESAARQYQEAARQSPESVVIQLRMAGVYLRSDPIQAESCLRKALSLDPKSVPARRMLAVLLATRGSDEDLRKADELLSTADDGGLTGVEDRRLRAMLLAHRGGTANISSAVTILEQILERGSNGLPADRLALAKLYETQARRTVEPRIISSKLDAAKKQLLNLAARPDSEPGQIGALVGFLLRTERRDEAGSWLDTLDERLSRAAKDNPDAIAQYVELRLRHGTVAGCEAWIDRLAKADTSTRRPLELRVRCLVSKDRDADVESLVEPYAQGLLAQETNRDSRQQIYQTVSAIYSAVYRYQSAERWLRLLVEVDPKQFHLLANVLGQQGRVGEAVELCEQMSKNDPSLQPALVMAATLVGSKPKPEDFRRAEPLLKSALSQFGSDVKLLYAIGVLRVVEGRYEESIQLFRKVVGLNPQHVAAINNLALLLSESPDSRKEALTLIDRAIDLSGMEPGLLDTKGAILIYDGQADKAVSLLEVATRGQEANPLHSFHLAVAYRDTGNSEKARTALRHALDQQLDAQILTTTDRVLLIDMKGTFAP